MSEQLNLSALQRAFDQDVNEYRRMAVTRSSSARAAAESVTGFICGGRTVLAELYLMIGRSQAAARQAALLALEVSDEYERPEYV